MNKLLRKCGEYISRTKSALLTLGLVGASLFANAQTFYGIAGSDLVMFTTTTTSSVTTVGTITGLVMGQSLVGLDFRPATGQLYGLGYDASTGAARLYLINRTTAAATPIGATNLAFMAGETGFGMDFNPTVDRIRVITAGGRNYRLHPNTGAIAFTDGNLAYATGDVNVGATDAFVACAYTNSYIGATTTALYDIGAVTNALSLQNPPNNGTLNTIGSMGLTINNTTDATDADIYYDAAMNMNMAYLSTKVGATTNFYGLNTSTGATTLIGALNVAITDFSAQVTPNMPTNISGKLVYGVTANNYLISFDSDAPSVVRMHLPISGLGANQAIAGMDVRPATGQIYVLGYNAMNGDAQLYTLDPSTAALTMVAAPDTIAMGLTQISFDFNPTVDRIRVEASTGQNYRFHPTTGVVVFVDGMLAYAATDANAGRMPRIGAAGYTNSFGGSNNTKLYVYDDSLNIFAIQNPPNAGTLNTIGVSGVTQSAMDMTSDMDIYYDHMTHTNTAYFVSNSSSYDMLYRVNLTTGNVQSVGSVGNGIALKDIAVRLDSITTVSSTASTISPSACNTYTAPDGAMYMASGTYMAIIPNMMGYDSLMTINLTINMIDTGAMMMGADSLVAAQDSAMYQWINCATGMNISGAMNRVFMPTASGSYAVMVTTAQGCMTTSACISFTLVGVDEVSNNNTVAAYPNPTKGLFTIENANNTPQMLIISDALGRKVYTANIQGTTTIDLSNLQTGLYYAQLGNNIIKIVKE